jgi:hypothetical protein
MPDSGVIHQNVEASVFTVNCLGRCAAIRLVGDVQDNEPSFAFSRNDLAFDSSSVFDIYICDVNQRSGSSEGFRDGLADSGRGPSDKSGFVG